MVRYGKTPGAATRASGRRKKWNRQFMLWTVFHAVSTWRRNGKVNLEAAKPCCHFRISSTSVTLRICSYSIYEDRGKSVIAMMS